MKLFFFVLFSLVLSSAFCQGSDVLNSFLANFTIGIVNGGAELTLGDGDRGIIITSDAQPGYYDLERTELDIENENEWTFEWIDTTRTQYHIVNDDGNILLVGPSFEQSISDNVQVVVEGLVENLDGIIHDLIEQRVDDAYANPELHVISLEYALYGSGGQ